MASKAWKAHPWKFEFSCCDGNTATVQTVICGIKSAIASSYQYLKYIFSLTWASLAACLMTALACPLFWQEETKYDLKPKGNSWARLPVLKEVESASPVGAKLTGTALGIQWTVVWESSLLLLGQAMEIGSAALNILVECWDGHLTPPEVASLADRASRARDSNMVRAAAELALSCLPHAHALNPNEIQRALVQCKEQVSIIRGLASAGWFPASRACCYFWDWLLCYWTVLIPVFWISHLMNNWLFCCIVTICLLPMVSVIFKCLILFSCCSFAFLYFWFCVLHFCFSFHPLGQSDAGKGLYGSRRSSQRRRRVPRSPLWSSSPVVLALWTNCWWDPSPERRCHWLQCQWRTGCLGSSAWVDRQPGDLWADHCNSGSCGDCGSNSHAGDLRGVNHVPAAYDGRAGDGTHTHAGPPPLHHPSDSHPL